MIEQNIKNLIEDYERRIKSTKELIATIEKPINNVKNPIYMRLIVKINCYQQTLRELKQLTKKQ
jgi:hypothetical protein